MPQFPAQYVVYAYLYIAVGLLLFNLAYMNSQPGKILLQKRRAKRWAASLRNKIADTNTPAYSRAIRRNLGHINQMRAFSDALELLEEESPDQLRRWLRENAELFRDVAADYRKHNSMERAYCAWMLARFSLIGAQDNVLLHTMIQYLDNSTIFCRENVLKAIYQSGSVSGVVEVFRHFNDRSYYHNRKLLSDGLATFTGDQVALAQALWTHRKEWNGDLMAAIVQFITRMGPKAEIFEEPFLQAVLEPSNDPEFSLALIRYFARFRYEPARETLRRFAEEKEQTLFAIVAVTALANYPGEDSIASLQQAVCSRNWYVRTNAAASLIALTRDHPNREQLLSCPDAYGAESIAYCLNAEKAAKAAVH